MAKAWERFPKLKAVAGRKVKIVQSDTILRPSLRLLQGISIR